MVPIFESSLVDEHINLVLNEFIISPAFLVDSTRHPSSDRCSRECVGDSKNVLKELYELRELRVSAKLIQSFRRKILLLFSCGILWHSNKNLIVASHSLLVMLVHCFKLPLEEFKLFVAGMAVEHSAYGVEGVVARSLVDIQ